MQKISDPQTAIVVFGLFFALKRLLCLFLCKFYIESIIIYNSKMFNSIWNDFTEKYEKPILKKDIIGYGYREAKYFEETFGSSGMKD